MRLQEVAPSVRVVDLWVQEVEVRLQHEVSEGVNPRSTSASWAATTISKQPTANQPIREGKCGGRVRIFPFSISVSQTKIICSSALLNPIVYSTHKSTIFFSLQTIQMEMGKQSSSFSTHCEKKHEGRAFLSFCLLAGFACDPNTGRPNMHAYCTRFRFGSGVAATETYSFSRLLYCSCAFSISSRRFCSC